MRQATSCVISFCVGNGVMKFKGGQVFVKISAFPIVWYYGLKTASNNIIKHVDAKKKKLERLIVSLNVA